MQAIQKAVEFLLEWIVANGHVPHTATAAQHLDDVRADGKEFEAAKQSLVEALRNAVVTAGEASAALEPVSDEQPDAEDAGEPDADGLVITPPVVEISGTQPPPFIIPAVDIKTGQPVELPAQAGDAAHNAAVNTVTFGVGPAEQQLGHEVLDFVQDQVGKGKTTQEA
jgi:hypothetical protein